jgi:hypothetical protein
MFIWHALGHNLHLQLHLIDMQSDGMTFRPKIEIADVNGNSFIL